MNKDSVYIYAPVKIGPNYAVNSVWNLLIWEYIGIFFTYHKINRGVFLLGTKNNHYIITTLTIGICLKRRNYLKLWYR